MILNTTKRHSDRYQIQPGKMGGAGDPNNHVNNCYHIVSGIDRGNGYQGYMAVTYFLSDDIRTPDATKMRCRRFLRQKGFDLNTWLKS
jgi:hypothetical protein